MANALPCFVPCKTLKYQGISINLWVCKETVLMIKYFKEAFELYKQSFFNTRWFLSLFLIATIITYDYGITNGFIIASIMAEISIILFNLFLLSDDYGYYLQKGTWKFQGGTRLVSIISIFCILISTLWFSPIQRLIILTLFITITIIFFINILVNRNKE